LVKSGPSVLFVELLIDSVTLVTLKEIDERIDNDELADEFADASDDDNKELFVLDTKLLLALTVALTLTVELSVAFTTAPIVTLAPRAANVTFTEAAVVVVILASILKF